MTRNQYDIEYLQIFNTMDETLPERIIALDAEYIESLENELSMYKKEIEDVEENTDNIDIPSWMDFEPYRSGYIKAMRKIKERQLKGTT